MLIAEDPRTTAARDEPAEVARGALALLEPAPDSDLTSRRFTAMAAELGIDAATRIGFEARR